MEEELKELERISNIEFISWMVCMFLGVILGFVIGIHIRGIDTKAKAVEYNCGQYNPQTGNFEWKEATNERAE